MTLNKSLEERFIEGEDAVILGFFDFLLNPEAVLTARGDEVIGGADEFEGFEGQGFVADLLDFFIELIAAGFLFGNDADDNGIIANGVGFGENFVGLGGADIAGEVVIEADAGEGTGPRDDIGEFDGFGACRIGNDGEFGGNCDHNGLFVGGWLGIGRDDDGRGHRRFGQDIGVKR